MCGCGICGRITRGEMRGCGTRGRMRRGDARGADTASAGSTMISPTGWAAATPCCSGVGCRLTAGSVASAGTRLFTDCSAASGGVIGLRSVGKV